MKEYKRMKQARFYNSKDNAPRPNKPSHIGAVAIIRQNNCVLLEKRRDSDRWAFIGGGLKIDETLEDCVKREIREETGLSVKKLNFLNIFSNPYRIAEYPDGNIIRIVTVLYEALVEGKEIKCSEESKELNFFSKDELKSIHIAETHKDIHEYYLEHF